MKIGERAGGWTAKAIGRALEITGVAGIGWIARETCREPATTGAGVGSSTAKAIGKGRGVIGEKGIDWMIQETCKAQGATGEVAGASPNDGTYILIDVLVIHCV